MIGIRLVSSQAVKWNDYSYAIFITDLYSDLLSCYLNFLLSSTPMNAALWITILLAAGIVLRFLGVAVIRIRVLDFAFCYFLACVPLLQYHSLSNFILAGGYGIAFKSCSHPSHKLLLLIML